MFLRPLQRGLLSLTEVFHMKTPNITYDICRNYILDNELNIPDSERMLGYVRSRSFEKLAQVTTEFDMAKRNINEYRCLLQIEAFFKKNATFESSSARDNALNSFKEAESVCSNVNRRLDVFSGNPEYFGDRLNRQIQKMQYYIASTLGDFSDFRREIPSLIQVTAGATSTKSRKHSLPFQKIGKRNISCTHGAQKYLLALSHTFGYGKVTFKPTFCNRVTFVPKNWKTDRTIACEPTGNIPLQLAFDSYAKGRLRRRGIDLSDQSKNQRLAAIGSMSGTSGETDYATVDLAAASDTISYNAVCLLFPWEWFKYLSDLRSSRYMLDDEVSIYHKFSSMGNGTTFPVETMVFAAACYAVGSRDFSVYGDDIIISSHLYDDLLALLSFLGFTVNQDKSFRAGPFRESCGGNYYEGVDITPFYLRTVDGRKATLSHNVNGLVSISPPEGKLWHLLKKLVRKEKLPLVPYNYGTTTGVHVDPSTAWKLSDTRFNKYLQAPEYRAYCLQGKTRYVGDSRTSFLWHLSGVKRKGKSEVLPSLRSYSSHAFQGGDGSIPTISNVLYSSVPTLRHKFVRKWVRWFHPSTGVPDHLYWWSEFISPS